MKLDYRLTFYKEIPNTLHYLHPKKIKRDSTYKSCKTKEAINPVFFY